MNTINFIKANTGAAIFGRVLLLLLLLFGYDGEDAGASEGGVLLVVRIPSHSLAGFAQRFQLQNEQTHQRELGVGSHTSRPRDRQLRVSLPILLLLQTLQPRFNRLHTRPWCKDCLRSF